MPEIGVGANRYTLILVGSVQKLRLQSWDALPRIDKTVEYAWKPGVWYTLKLTMIAGVASLLNVFHPVFQLAQDGRAGGVFHLFRAEDARHERALLPQVDAGLDGLLAGGVPAASGEEVHWLVDSDRTAGVFQSLDLSVADLETEGADAWRPIEIDRVRVSDRAGIPGTDVRSAHPACDHVGVHVRLQDLAYRREPGLTSDDAYWIVLAHILAGAQVQLLGAYHR